MTASPYDIVAYRPAVSSEFSATMTSFCTGLSPRTTSLRGDRCDRRTGRVLLRPDQVHLPAGLVLRHDEGYVRLAGLGEVQHLAGDDALLHPQAGERGADLLRFERPRLGDGVQQGP